MLNKKQQLVFAALYIVGIMPGPLFATDDIETPKEAASFYSACKFCFVCELGKDGKPLERKFFSIKNNTSSQKMPSINLYKEGEFCIPNFLDDLEKKERKKLRNSSFYWCSPFPLQEEELEAIPDPNNAFSAAHLMIKRGIHNSPFQKIKLLNLVDALLHKSSPVKMGFHRDRIHKDPEARLLVLQASSTHARHQRKVAIVPVQRYSWKEANQAFSNAKLAYIKWSPSKLKYYNSSARKKLLKEATDLQLGSEAAIAHKLAKVLAGSYSGHRGIKSNDMETLVERSKQPHPRKISLTEGELEELLFQDNGGTLPTLRQIRTNMPIATPNNKSSLAAPYVVATLLALLAAIPFRGGIQAMLFDTKEPKAKKRRRSQTRSLLHTSPLLLSRCPWWAPYMGLLSSKYSFLGYKKTFKMPENKIIYFFFFSDKPILGTLI